MSARYEHHNLDIQNVSAIAELFKRHLDNIGAIEHSASQPWHDRAARDPQTDL
jgi:CDP-paratose 2-epimerase